MATYFVASGGSNTAPYDTWAKAATSLATVLAAASTNGDVVAIQYNAVPATDAELSADTTYSPVASIYIISASNDGGSSYTPTEMGAANWIGNSATNRFVKFNVLDKEIYFYGVTLRVSGASSDDIGPADAVGQSVMLEKCLLWQNNTATVANIALASTTGSLAHYKECVFRFNGTSQGIKGIGRIIIERCSISADGSTPTSLILTTTAGVWRFIGCDFSIITGTLVADSPAALIVFFERCKFGAGVTVLAAQTSNPTKATPEVSVFDCSSGDTHTTFGWYTGTGSIVSNTGTYLTAGASGQSWEITTTANCSSAAPVIGPWIDLYNTGTGAITPYIECLRNNGTATAYNDNQVWAEFSYKNTSNSTQASGWRTDRQALSAILAGTAATAQAAGAGTSAWTIGSSNSPASFKCDSGSSMTPTEIGYIRARVCLAVPSITVYVDPQIRT